MKGNLAMKIYLLRHGETDWNKKKRMSCNNEAKLNETGFNQAKRAGKFLADKDYDLVISSPYERAKLTAEIANTKDIPLIIDDRLRERNSGVLDGRPFSEFTQTDIENFYNYNKNIEYEGAENIQDFCERVWSFLEAIKQKYQNISILLVTHNIVIRAIKAYVFGIPTDGNINKYGIKNGTVEEIEI